jgi:predicted nucleotidyltransferase/predicted nucleic acid-binding protein
MRIFLDANILFSAAKSNGAVRRLLELLLEAGHECVVDAYVTEEVRRNLAAKAPEGMDFLGGLLSRFNVAAVQAQQTSVETDPPLPEDDRPILAAAIHNGCAALVTGDRTHFGPLYGKTIEGVAIHSPRSFAQALGLAQPPASSTTALHAPGAAYAVRRSGGGLKIPRERLAELCRKYGVKKLSLFGSVARNETTPDSDIDLMVEFEAGSRTSLWDMPRMQREFSALFDGHPVELVPPEVLNNPFRRKRIEPELQVLYEA